jgi:hypothetical protein
LLNSYEQGTSFFWPYKNTISRNSRSPRRWWRRILTITRGAGPAGPAIAITGNSGLEAMG